MIVIWYGVPNGLHVPLDVAYSEQLYEMRTRQWLLNLFFNICIGVIIVSVPELDHSVLHLRLRPATMRGLL